MEILDSDGKLFGYVNIIDALVVLFIVAVLAAGIALVAGGGGPGPGSGASQSSVSAGFATITVGPVSEDTATTLAGANSLTVAGTGQTLNVTDTVRTPDPSRDGAFVFVRVRIPESISPSNLSGDVGISTGQLSSNGTVGSFGNRSTIQSRQTSLTVETTVSEQVAASISQGDTFELGNDTVATITDIRLLGERDGGRGLRVALDVTAVHVDGTSRFARQSLRLGSSLPFRTDSYSFSGEIVSRSGGIPAAENVTVQTETTVPDEVARTVESGDEYTVGPTSVARIETVSLVPVGESRTKLVMNLSLQAMTVDNETRFLGRSVQAGTSVPFRTAEYTLSPTITSLSPERVQRETLTTRVRTTVSNDVADSITSGDTYRVNDRTIAEIDDVAAYPVAGSDRQRLSMTMSLETVLDEGTPQLLGAPVRIGSTVPFETSSYQFTGSVVSQNSSTAGTPVDATLELRWENISPELADAVGPGMAEQHRGATATITDVEREPATVITRSEGGDIFAREHPVNEDVTLTVSASASRQNGRLTFHGQSVQTGDTVVLDFGSVTVRGTIADVTADG